MDENLAITTNNFISNPLISPFKIEMQNLIDCIKASKKLHYDNKQKLIRFREKADRNIVIFKDILQDSNNENYENICKIIKQKITEKSQNLINNLKDVEKIEKNIFFNFENEKYACDLEKILVESKKNKENFFENLNYFLAAETYGRRITPYLNNRISQEEQINIINGILNKQKVNVSNKEKRRNTFDNNKINKRNFSILENNITNTITSINNNNNEVVVNKNFKKQPKSFKENYNNRFQRNSINIGINKNKENNFYNNYNNNLCYTPYYSKNNSNIDNNNNNYSNSNEIYNNNKSNSNNSLMNNANSSINNSLKGNNTQANYFFGGDLFNNSNSLYNYNYNNNSFNDSKKINNINSINNLNMNINMNMNMNLNMNMNMNMSLTNQPMNKFDLFILNNTKNEEKKINENNDSNFDNNNYSKIRRSSSKKLDPKNENLFDIKKIMSNLSSNNTNRNSINLEDRNTNSLKGSFSYLQPNKDSNINFNINNDNNQISRESIFSKFSNISSENGINRASFLSYGEENFINEIKKNFYLQRKSSLNYLKSNLNLLNLKSSFIIDNNNSNFISKENEKNGIGYCTTDIISVYFHMNYLKQFKFPQEFDNENNFLEGVMRKEVKHNLEKFKEKDVLLRSRARTMIFNITNNIKKRSTFILKL
jgi:hypothetical protein